MRTIALLLCLVPAAATALPRVLVPAYFDPATDPTAWSRMTSAAAQVPLTVIANPDSGPGTSADPSYTSALQALRSNGGQVIGYVATGFGDRAAGLVQDEIDDYLAFYPGLIDGFFLDEMSNDTADLAYYQGIHGFIKGRSAGLRVVGNPGTNTPEAFLAVADVLVIFEDPASTYAGNVTDAYVAAYPASRFGMILFDGSTVAAMNADIDRAIDRNVGLVYVTDDREVFPSFNPYDVLPSYWDNEVAHVLARQSRSSPSEDGYDTGGGGPVYPGSGGGYGSGGSLGVASLLILLALRRPALRNL